MKLVYWILGFIFTLTILSFAERKPAIKFEGIVYIISDNGMAILSDNMDSGDTVSEFGSYDSEDTIPWVDNGRYKNSEEWYKGVQGKPIITPIDDELLVTVIYNNISKSLQQILYKYNKKNNAGNWAVYKIIPIVRKK